MTNRLRARPGLILSVSCGFGLLCLCLARGGSMEPVQAAAHDPGRQTFVDSGCMQCHGPAGLGTQKGPSLRDVRKHKNDDQVRLQIKEGSNGMPAFQDVLTDQQLTELAVFLRSKSAWKQPLPAPTPAQ